MTFGRHRNAQRSALTANPGRACTRRSPVGTAFGVGALGSIIAASLACGDGTRGPSAAGAEPAPLAESQSALTLETAPESLAFRLDIEGRPFRLTLARSAAPVTSNYQSLRLRSDGTLVPLPPDPAGCSYTGRAEPLDGAGEAASGFATLSVCSRETGQPTGRAAAGVVRALGRFWRLTPNVADGEALDGVEHFLVPLQRGDIPPSTEPARATSLVREPVDPPRELAFREGTDEETKYIDLIIVNDAARVARLGGQTQAEGIRFVEAMNAILADSGLAPRLRVTLRAQVSFDQDPYSPAFAGDEVDHESLLDNFLAWGNTEELPDHDEHMLLSGLDFFDSTVGFAGLDVACSARANGFIVQANDAIGGFAVLSAVHELGHTLGMAHDDGITCPNRGFIMAAVGCANCPSENQFSSCSVEQFGQYLDGPAYAEGARCADDVPSGAASICGDGSVSGDEECDCGASDCSDIDPCCDGATCQLEAGAACSDFNDGCCQGCQIVGADAAVVCRAERSECDIPEVCTGASKECPRDAFDPAGGDCQDERGNPGSCYFGDCRSRASQCEQIAEQQGFANVGAPPPQCGQDCNRVVCGNGPNGCVIIQGPTVIDGVACDEGQCVDGACVALIDQCPEDASKDDPGQCGCGTPDDDSDGDDSADCVDACPEDGNKDAPGDCGCGRADTDSDRDGSADCVDECPNDAAKRAPGDCGCGSPETDSDGDGAADCVDECPNDAATRTATPCGCGVGASDGDGDGTPDCVDECPADRTRTTAPCSAGSSGPDSVGGDASASVSASASGGCSLAPSATPPSAHRDSRNAMWLLLAALPLGLRRRQR